MKERDEEERKGGRGKKKRQRKAGEVSVPFIALFNCPQDSNRSPIRRDNVDSEIRASVIMMRVIKPRQYHSQSFIINYIKGGATVFGVCSSYNGWQKKS